MVRRGHGHRVVAFAESFCHLCFSRVDPLFGLRDITLAPKKLILTRRASEGSASEPSLARRVSMC